jgi:hypothetical protein
MENSIEKPDRRRGVEAIEVRETVSVEIEKEAIIRTHSDAALRREIELVQTNTEKEMGRMMTSYRESNAVMLDRLGRIESHITAGNSPIMVKIEGLDSKIRNLEEGIKIRDTQLNTAAATLRTGWKITWGVISVIVATFVWVAINVPPLLQALLER